MTDSMLDIERERKSAQAALAEAENMMKECSRDPDAFRSAKNKRQEALEAIERLEWAAKAEQERQAEIERQSKIEALQEAQQRARAGHDRGRDISVELVTLTEAMMEKIKELREAAAAVERGAHYEAFALRDGYLERSKVPAKLDIDGELAIRILRVGRELARLAGINAQAAEMRAGQGRL